MGLGFLTKMGAIVVLVPLVIWLVASRLPRTFGPGGMSAWADGVLTSGAMLAPLCLALAEILRLRHKLPPPAYTDLFLSRPESEFPGVILAVPLAVWVIRRVLGRLFPGNRFWGAERPGLEIWTAILAFAPVVGWLGNPGWWRANAPRLAHYYMINTDRRGRLPDIQILYLGQIYEYSLPWHNAWVLIGATVPAAILAAAALGLVYTLSSLGRDRLPLSSCCTWRPCRSSRMFNTPAHDGIRLFLPTFFFLAGIAGWGALWLADRIEWLTAGGRCVWPRWLAAARACSPPPVGNWRRRIRSSCRITTNSSAVPVGRGNRPASS